MTHDFHLLESVFVEALHAALSRELGQSMTLLKKPYRAEYEAQWPENPLYGHCYAAAEAARAWLFEQTGVQYKPMVMRLPEGGTHWALGHPSGRIFDPTASQFSELPDYEQMRGCGFQTKNPSRRGQAIYELVMENLPPEQERY